MSMSRMEAATYPMSDLDWWTRLRLKVLYLMTQPPDRDQPASSDTPPTEPPTPLVYTDPQEPTKPRIPTPIRPRKDNS